MTHSEFFAAISQNNLAGIYLFEGEEEYVKDKARQALRKKILPPGIEMLNETILHNPTAGDIIAAAETLPMMSERRLVTVCDSALLLGGKAAAEANESAALIACLDNPPETACLLFYVRGMPDGRKKLTQALSKKGTVVKFDRLGDAEMHRWIAQELRAQGKAITPQTASALVFTAGRELLTLSQELRKLAAYAADRAEISNEDIEAVVTPTLECTVFQLVDALVAGKEAEAFHLLNIMLENGEARIGILAMMARQYRNLLHLKLMQQERVSEGEMQKRLGVPPFALRRLLAQSKNAQAEALRAKLDICVDTDFAIKSGKMREDAALERAMFRLCGNV